MYDVPRTHSQRTTEQPAGLAALYWSKRPAVPPKAWSSPVITTAAFSLRGRYQKRGIGFRSRLIVSIRFASRRCCSSACGMSILVVSSQSGWTSPALRAEEEVVGADADDAVALLSDPAGFPWRV